MTVQKANGENCKNIMNDEDSEKSASYSEISENEARNSEAVTTLLDAIHDDTPVGTIKDLIASSGIDVNGRGRSNLTPLLMAAYKGHRETVAYLLDEGADSSLADDVDMYPVMEAASRGHHEALEELLSQGADPDYVDGLCGSTALIMAVQDRHPECVRLLLEHGASLSVRDDIIRNSGDTEGKTAKELAMAPHPHVEILALIEEEERKRAQPNSLMEMCRHIVRTQLGRQKLRKTIYSLPIPTLLKNYLLFKRLNI